MLKEILFTHDDLDGVSCGILFTLAHQHMEAEKDYQIIPCSNVNIDTKVLERLEQKDLNVDTFISFSDICPSRGILEILVKKFKKVMVWDHHRTNIYCKQVIPEAVLIPETAEGKMESGTSLFYQYFRGLAYDNPPDERGHMFQEGIGNQKLLADFVENVRSYDTYEWKKTDNIQAKELQTLYFLLGSERFASRYLKRILDINSGDQLILDTDIEFVRAKIEQEQRSIETITTDDVYTVDIKGFKTAVRFAYGGMNISELAHSFLNKFNDYDVFIGINVGGRELQYRTIREDLDVGFVLAKPAGGGGHPKASGSPIPEELRREMLDMILYHIDPDGATESFKS